MKHHFMKRLGTLFFVFLFWLACFCKTASVSATNSNPDLGLYATAAALIDAESGRLLYGRNTDRVLAMASTTKIMTCIIVLEQGCLEEELEVSHYASTMPKVKLYLQKGERYRVRDLLYSLMLESHNDSAVALAEHVGKKLVDCLRDKAPGAFTVEESKMAVNAFADLMNQYAREIGCKDTYFITPNGLDATTDVVLEDGSIVTKSHETTAYELANIMAYCVHRSPQKDMFLRITSTPSYQFQANNKSFYLENLNQFLTMMEGAISGKTGFTNKAGYCYVGALKRDDRTFIVALLGCGWPNNKDWKWADTKNLMQYGLEHYYFRAFENPTDLFSRDGMKSIPVMNGRGEAFGEDAFAKIGIIRDEDAVLDGILMRKEEEILALYHIIPYLEAPVLAGTKVGELKYIVDGKIYRTAEIVTLETVEKWTFRWCLMEVFSRYLSL